MEQQVIPYGYCHCGCGQPTKIIAMNDAKRGRVKGQPYRFITGHGSRRSEKKRYTRIFQPDSPNADAGGYLGEHIAVAERILGKPLPAEAEVHHLNRIGTDNAPANLVICENHAYHMLIHARTRALKACGNPNWRKCSFCKCWDDPANMNCSGAAIKSPSFYHQECHREHNRLYMAAKRAAKKADSSANAE